ncbi:MAG: hypothetical protein C5B43_04965, partial [Verrucomicrobia bacterium]
QLPIINGGTEISSKSQEADLSELEGNLNESEQEYGVLDFDRTLIAKARENSTPNFERKIPSLLKNRMSSDELVSKLKTNQDYSSIEYGNWWHKMMESLPWKHPKEWDLYLVNYLSKCPEPIRGQNEIQLFSKSQDLKTLINESINVETELPFLYRKEGQDSFEGYIDFVGHNDTTNSIFIIDWKTDLIDFQENAIDYLRECYRTQLNVYREGLEKFYRRKVDIFLYSTVLGKLIVY